MKKERNKLKPMDKEEFKKKYYSIGKIYSPAIGSEVAFNGRGLNHIYYAGSRSDRKKADIAIKQHMFDRVVKLIEKTNTLTGKHVVIRTKNIIYYELIGLIDHRRIKAVLRKVGNGNIHFWSVIPQWDYCSDGSYFNMGGKVLE